MTLDFHKFCEPCTVRYYRNELHESEIRNISSKMERALRVPLFYFLHAFDISTITAPHNLLYTMTRPFELQIERQVLQNSNEPPSSRNNLQDSVHPANFHRQTLQTRTNPLQTHRLATLGLILAIISLILLATDLFLITLVIQSTALILALISNRVETRTWRQRLTIALTIIYWIVLVFMLIVYFNELFSLGF